MLASGDFIIVIISATERYKYTNSAIIYSALNENKKAQLSLTNPRDAV